MMLLLKITFEDTTLYAFKVQFLDILIIYDNLYQQSSIFMAWRGGEGNRPTLALAGHSHSKQATAR